MYLLACSRVNHQQTPLADARRIATTQQRVFAQWHLGIPGVRLVLHHPSNFLRRIFQPVEYPGECVQCSSQAVPRVAASRIRLPRQWGIFLARLCQGRFIRNASTVRSDLHNESHDIFHSLSSWPERLCRLSAPSS